MLLSFGEVFSERQENAVSVSGFGFRIQNQIEARRSGFDLERRSDGMNER